MSFSEKPNLQLFISRLLARSVLTDEEQQAIMDLPTQAIELRKGQDIVQLNEQSSYACLTVTGLVGRFAQTANGARQVTAFHIPGDIADLHSAVRPVGIGGLTALADTLILRIPHAAIHAMMRSYPGVAEALWRDTLLDAAVGMQWMINVGRRDARTRIAHIFCEMALRSGNDREVMLEYEFPVTQEQLGDAAALTSVHVNRCLKSMDNLVTLRSGKVHIRNWNELARVGQFDPTYLVADTAADRRRVFAA